MGFSERDKLVALAIVHIFETGKPFGDYSAVAVLNDGAGISYGVNQFTHRSGSLYRVLERFVSLGGRLTPTVTAVVKNFKSGSLIGTVAANATVKSDLRRLGSDPLMQRAQQEIAFEMYLKPAIEACEGSDFTLPLSLAVIYDSINHGSYERIRDRVIVERPGNGSMKEEEFEKEWISRYVKKRDAWLESIPRLKATDYRTDFFLAQIARENWFLRMPITVQGVRLTESMFETANPFAGLTEEEIAEGSGEGQVTGDEGSEGGEQKAEGSGQKIEGSGQGAVSGEMLSVQPSGDAPNARPSFFVTLEDWKPLVVRWLKRIWGGTTAGNFTQATAFFGAAVKDPPNWMIYAAAAVAIMLITGGIATFVSLVLVGIWLWNRRYEIAPVFRQQNEIRANPNLKNFGVEFEKK